MRTLHNLRKEVEKARSAFEGEYGKKYFSSKSDSPSQWPNACTILRWKRIYRASGRRIESLKDHRGKASSIDIDQESYVFITSRLREFLTEQRHSGNEVIAKTIMEIEVENAKRAKNNQTLLQSRCRSVLHEWLKKFGQFAIMAGREGLTAAKREYSGVGKTERATRPGECFQIDEWEVDARTFIMSGPLREGLDKKTLAALPRGRRWMYIVIDVATRYVVGFALSASQNPEAAVRSLRMATKNKDHLAKAAGARNGWDGMQFESLQSDTGSAFFSEYTHRAVSTAYATYFFPQVGQFITKGVGHPEQLEINHQRDLIRIGFAVTERGNPAVYDAVDKALCKHRLRLSKTWLHNWALLSVNPPERQFFRGLMKRLCADQGQYCLVSISTDMSVERLVDGKILDIAQATNRHHSWVRTRLDA